MCTITVNKIADTKTEDVPVAEVILFLNGQVAFYLDLLPLYNLLTLFRLGGGGGGLMPAPTLNSSQFQII